MSHIHTRPGQHDHTISMFIVRTDQSEPKIMFHLHKKYQVYMQFGGHIELDENPWQAIRRELREEAGYKISQLDILQPKEGLKKLTGVKLHPIPVAYTTHKIWGLSDHYHIDTAFAFIADQEPAHSLSADESDDIKLFSRDGLANLPSEKTYENGREIALFILKNIGQWRRIPAEKIKS